MPFALDNMPGRYILKGNPDGEPLALELTIHPDGHYTMGALCRGPIEERPRCLGRWKFEDGRLVCSRNGQDFDNWFEIDLRGLSRTGLKNGLGLKVQVRGGGTGEAMSHGFDLAQLD